jgi:hypothetical protein
MSRFVAMGEVKSMTEQRSAAASSLPSMKRGQLSDLFESGSVDAVPDGKARGTVLLGTGGVLGRAVAVFSHAVLWRGKVVDASRGRLQNLVGPLGTRAIAAAVYEGPSWHDGKPCIVLDYSKTSLVARMIRDEIREISPGTFLGLVFVGRVHVLDFALSFRR